jgi:2-polyprenyl-6-methoxyphenol hydroxylase-like FAD-dependent oxidoreductase
MARVVMVGGGVVGLCGALMLGRDGHEVTVLERDAAPPPDPEAAWDGWERRGVNQFRMLHYFAPRFRGVMEANAPEVVRALEDAGALVSNPFRQIPAEVTGGFRESDAVYDAVTARRPIAEAAIAGVVDANENVTVRRGTAVAGLITGDSAGDGVPHVIGVRTEAGDDVTGDVVIDAGGRRSTLPKLLAGIGAREPIEEKEDCGFVYYGRHFRSADGSVPAMFGPLLMPYESLSILTLPADNGTWGVGLVVSAKDAALRGLKDLDTWTRTVKGYPLAAHWLDGEPIDDGVSIMAMIEDRHRTFVIDGKPVATGVLALADSWACTNPSVGRGISIGAIHAAALRGLLQDGGASADPVELARGWYDATMETVEPWYRGTLSFDQGRLAQIHAEMDGAPFEPTPEYEMTMALQVAAGKDPEMLRTFLDIAGVIDSPEQVFARPGLFEKVIELGSGWRDQSLPGMSRQELLAVVGS